MSSDTLLIYFVLVFLDLFNSVLKTLMVVQQKRNTIADLIKKSLIDWSPFGIKRSRPSLVKVERPFACKTSTLDLMDCSNLCQRKKQDTKQPSFMNVTIVLYPLAADLKSFITATGKTVENMMENYWTRLSTYASYPPGAPVSAMRLCDAGFYFENSEGDEVKCFKCGIKYKWWLPGDVPVLVHKTISPACEYIRNKLPPTGDEFGPRDRVVQQRIENNVSVNNASSQSIETGASGTNDTMRHVMSVRTEPERSKSKPYFAFSQLATSVASQQTQTTADETYMTITSQHGTSSGKVCVQDCLAVVQGNEGALRDRAAVALSSSTPSLPSALNAESLELTTAKPQHPHQKVSVKAQRRQTVSGFPNIIKQTEEELPNSGFFYAGVIDTVRCFDYGGGLREWEPEDFSLEECAKLYQKMKRQKARVDDILITSVHNSQYEIQRKEIEQRAAEEKKKDIMQLPAVVSVLEMGYPDNLVIQAYQRCVSENGESVMTADVLLDAVFQLEGEEIQSNSTNGEILTPQREQAGEPTEQTAPKQVLSGNHQGNDESVEDLEQKNRIPKERQLCKICMEEEAAIIFLPCGHMVTCVSCAAAIRNCLICQIFIRGTNEVKCPNYKPYDTRLNSYKGFPDDLTQKPEELARAGFFYEGKGDRVKCFACGERVSDWKIRGNPWIEHASLSQTCEHLRQYKGDSFSKTVLDEPNESMIGHNSVITGNFKVTETVEGACGSSRGETRRTSINYASASKKSKQSPDSQGITKKSQTGDRSSSVTHPVIVMQSGKSKTPRKTETAKCKRKNIANIALESSLTKDSNGVKQKSFVSAEGAGSTHKSSSVEKANTPRNIHSSEAFPNVSFNQHSRVDARGQGNASAVPKCQMYSAYSRRLQTFKEYPKDMHQKPEELATAGFFYIGKEDHVRCFYCGGGLKEWDPEEDPWTEHARWFPSCGYLRQSKGDEYIKNVCSELRRRDKQRKQAQRRAMELAVINTVVEMGYPEVLVNQAFRKCATEQGDSNVKADAVLQELWRQEEQNPVNISNEDEEGSNETPLSQKKTKLSKKIPSEIKQSNTDDIRKLEEENVLLKEHMMCKICMEGETTRAFFPCGHLATCNPGEAVLHCCPMCQVFLTMKCEENERKV